MNEFPNSDALALPPLPERDTDELRCAVWDSLCYWRNSGSGVDALQASNEAEDMLDKLLHAYARQAIAAAPTAPAPSIEPIAAGGGAAGLHQTLKLAREALAYVVAGSIPHDEARAALDAIDAALTAGEGETL